MGKKFIMFFLTAVLAAVLSGCTKTSEKGSMTNTDTELQNGEKVINGTETPLESGDVELVVWGAEEDLRTALFMTLLVWGRNREINNELWKREYERANKAEAMLNSQPSGK